MEKKGIFNKTMDPGFFSISQTKRFAILDVASGSKNAGSRGLSTSTISPQKAKSKVLTPLFSPCPISKSSLTLGENRVSLKDLCLVATQRATVSIDAKYLEKLNRAVQEMLIEKDVSIDSSMQSLESNEMSTPGNFPVEICRAGLFFRLRSLLQGRLGVRGEVMTFITQLLNDHIIPVFSCDEHAGVELVKIMSGGSVWCYTINGLEKSDTALQGKTLTLSSREQITLSDGKFLTTGASCLIAFGASSIQSSLDCIAALSCECVGAESEPFSAMHFENNRQHRGQITSSSNLRYILEGSKKINTTNKPSTVFRTIPQINGPIQESLAVAIR